ncbi:MAG: hypothetical protein OXE74_04500 [Cyanobacteria bacterium MAG CAR2_bin_4]|nr:hypothetical protein [Cyanobacteria bacterium MAG CAR2_bin_4]
MGTVGPDNSSHHRANGSGSNTDDEALSPKGMSPYATGGGGVTFERKVAVQYLAHLLVGDNAPELGDSRRIVSVAFQQAPSHPVDDLLVQAARPNESQPSLKLALGVRRSINLVKSDGSTQKLIGQFIHAAINDNEPADGTEHHLGLVVSQPQPHAQELAKLADMAKKQSNPEGFFNLARTPRKFPAKVRDRLDHLEDIVKDILANSNTSETSQGLVEKCTWQMLSKLTVSMPRLESPDEADWCSVVNSLQSIVRDADRTEASRLRDRLLTLASEYSPRAANVDLTTLRRDTHELLDCTRRLHRRGWQRLNSLNQQARQAVRAEITESDGNRHLRLNQNDKVKELIEKISNIQALIVTGESGIGKSALAVLELISTADANPKRMQILCVNLHHIPKLVIEMERILESPLHTLLNELSAPQRFLVIDGADAVTAERHDAFRYLVNSAKDSCVKVVAVTSTDSKQVVSDIMRECFDICIQEYAMSHLDNSEIDKLVEVFPELTRLSSNPRSRKLLRRLVVVDLLVRGKISGTPLTDADAMNEVWTGLVRRHGKSDRGFPNSRETTLLKIAELELGKGERLDVINSVDPSALDGLCRDGLLRNSPADSLRIGPEFAHDEVRRYAVARFLLASDNNPGYELLKVNPPRWSLAAARLACQAWLGKAHTSRLPLSGRFAELQESLEALVKKGHGSRWGDVPTEALLTLTNPESLLRDAWPHLTANEGTGLQRLFRLVNQRLRDKAGVIDIIAVEPIIKILLKETTSWQFGRQFRELVGDPLVSWLRGHVIANTPGGHPLRLLLRQRLVDACAEADRRFEEERQGKAAEHTPEAAEHERQTQEERGFFSDTDPSSHYSRHRQEKIPREIKDELVLQLLALLGPDLGEEGKAILMRVAKDAQHYLGPAVDDFWAGRALAKDRSGLLAELTEAYYLDEEVETIRFSSLHTEGVRPHRGQFFHGQRGAWHRGPFIPLFQIDFCNGVQVLNRLLNHAARIRVIDLVHHGYGYLPQSIKFENLKLYENKFKITGNCKSYIGDEHVWRWYRGTGVGPDPCSSALQALEIVCDQMLKESNISLETLITIMLNGCENLAMLGLIVGLLMRHLEQADNLLDPYLVEPLIWHYEFARVVGESSGLAASSDNLVAPERRKWSLREAAFFMVTNANNERDIKLRNLGHILISNAEKLVTLAPDHKICQRESKWLVSEAHVWASSLDRDTYQVRKGEGGTWVETKAPDDVVQALQERTETADLTIKALGLLPRYSIGNKEMISRSINTDDLISDIAFVQNLLNKQVSLGSSPWDISALIAAAALKAHLVDSVSLPNDVLLFSVEILLRIGESAGEAREAETEYEFSEDKDGADRSAARILPLLLLPNHAQLRALVDEENGSNTFERTVQSCFNLARVMTDEVRLYLAHGLDYLWETPYEKNECCHHELGWKIVIEMMRCCVFDSWKRLRILALEEPIIESLASTADTLIRVSQLDAAIRALAPAAMAHICISCQAKDLLLVLLAAQQRALLVDKRYTDPHGLQVLVSARALLTLARDNDDVAIKAIYDHVNGYGDNLALLENFLRALSAAAEETSDRAEVAWRLWPNLIHYVLRLMRSKHITWEEDRYSEMVFASLIPNHIGENTYRYRELNGDPIQWWKPLELKTEIEAWLVPAAGHPRCVDYLITFIDHIEPEQRALVGLPWIEKLMEPDPTYIAQCSSLLPYWLPEIKELAAISDETLAIWQRIVDHLVVAGNARLAEYSD